MQCALACLHVVSIGGTCNNVTIGRHLSAHNKKCQKKNLHGRITRYYYNKSCRFKKTENNIWNCINIKRKFRHDFIAALQIQHSALSPFGESFVFFSVNKSGFLVGWGGEGMVMSQSPTHPIREQLVLTKKIQGFFQMVGPDPGDHCYHCSSDSRCCKSL